jgi:hypothetical protein
MKNTCYCNGQAGWIGSHKMIALMQTRVTGPKLGLEDKSEQ